MIYFKQPLQSYNVDSYTMSLNVSNLSLFLRFYWPVDIQKLYDQQISVLDTSFRAQAYYLPTDPHNIQHIGYSQDLIEKWQSFLNAWTNHEDITDIVNNIYWPLDLREAVDAVLDDATDTILYTNIQALIDSLQPVIEYLNSLDEELLWRVTIKQGTEIRELCLNPNIWYFYGESNWRLAFISQQGRITKDNLGEVDLYIALGDGDI